MVMPKIQRYSSSLLIATALMCFYEPPAGAQQSGATGKPIPGGDEGKEIDEDFNGQPITNTVQTMYTDYVDVDSRNGNAVNQECFFAREGWDILPDSSRAEPHFGRCNNGVPGDSRTTWSWLIDEGVGAGPNLGTICIGVGVRPPTSDIRCHMSARGMYVEQLITSYTPGKHKYTVNPPLDEEPITAEAVGNNHQETKCFSATSGYLIDTRTIGVTYEQNSCNNNMGNTSNGHSLSFPTSGPNRGSVCLTVSVNPPVSNTHCTLAARLMYREYQP